MSTAFARLQEAAEAGELAVVRKLIESGVDQNTRPGAPHGWSPLIHAAYGGQLEVVRYLVEQGAELDFTQIERWGTALDFALSAGHQDVADYLKSVGVPLGRDVPNSYRGNQLGGWRDAP